MRTHDYMVEGKTTDLSSSGQIHLCPVHLAGRLIVLSGRRLWLDPGVPEVRVLEVEGVLRFDGGALDATLNRHVVRLLHVGHHQHPEEVKEIFSGQFSFMFCTPLPVSDGRLGGPTCINFGWNCCKTRGIFQPTVRLQQHPEVMKKYTYKNKS